MSRRCGVSLRLRLALLFALTCAILFALIGTYLYRALDDEVSHRDDAALLGRVERIQSFIQEARSVAVLMKFPQLYANMLGNQDSVFWVVDSSGRVLIAVNPAHLPMPDVSGLSSQLVSLHTPQAVRLAWLKANNGADVLTVIAGKLLAEHQKMMAAYQWKLSGAWLIGVLLAFVLGWEVVRRGLAPLRRLSDQAAQIDPQHLGMRIPSHRQPHELRVLADALNHMLSRIEEGYVRLARFSEDLAHEMRTPLNNLMLRNQHALHRTRTVEEYDNLLVMQQDEYERLARLIESMLFLARAEKRQCVPVCLPMNLNSLFVQLADYFEGMARERGMVLNVNGVGELCADQALVRRAVANLVVNAICYGQPDTAIELRSVTRRGAVDIEVFNRGEMIAARDLPQLFDRFFRCDPARARSGGSGGLGLAIVQSIMQMHGGEALVSSSAAGTLFTLRFPQAAVY